jgi:hypothetical protein
MCILQPERRRVWLEEAARVRLEHGYAQRDAGFTRSVACARDHRLVTGVYAIKISKRNRGAARVVRNC